MLSAFALGYALFQTPTGMLADRYGPRLVLAAVVVVWSAFTGLTGAVAGLAALLVVRFLFGAGEAGAFPGMARAIYAWIPMRERGLAQGVNFSGGAARRGVRPAGRGGDGRGARLAGNVRRADAGRVRLGGGVVPRFRDDPADHPGLGRRRAATDPRHPPTGGRPPRGPLPVGRLSAVRRTCGC